MCNLLLERNGFPETVNTKCFFLTVKTISSISKVFQNNFLFVNHKYVMSRKNIN